MHLHVCCKRDKNTLKAPNRRDLGHGKIQSATWRIPDHFLEGVTHIWLHQGQNADAYCGGEILDRRKSVPEDAPDECPPDVRDRWTFVYQKESSAGHKTRMNWSNNAWTVEPLA
jgi:hypothetical protein